MVAQGVRSLACVALVVGGVGKLGRQASNVTAEAAGMAECARFVRLLRLCILTTDMGFADGGSCGTGASAFTMVVVGSGMSVLVFGRTTARRSLPA